MVNVYVLLALAGMLYLGGKGIVSGVSFTAKKTSHGVVKVVKKTGHVVKEVVK